MKKEAKIFYNDTFVGLLWKEDGKYFFQYDENYLSDQNAPPISLSFKKQKDVFVSETLFPFFFGLLSEGENKTLLCRKFKIDEKDYFTLLLKTTVHDSIGGITTREK